MRSLSLGMFIRAEGKPQYFMRINILNVLMNILLNYIFVARLGWGVKGHRFRVAAVVLHKLGVYGEECFEGGRLNGVDILTR